MSFFKALFGKKKTEEENTSTARTHTSTIFKIKQIDRLTPEAVKITFEVPLLLKAQYLHQPGQYVNIIVELNGKKEHRSYSICSDVNEPLAIGVKKIENGYVSAYFNDKAKVGHKIQVSTPFGKFVLPKKEGKFVGIAAGSGITPILSILKEVNRTDGLEMDLIYGNRTEESIMFKDEISSFPTEKIRVISCLSEEEKEGTRHGMLTEQMFEEIFSDNPNLLEAEGFFICGPEQVIINAKNVLENHGISDEKIHYELFTTPVQIASSTEDVGDTSFNGIAQVTVILDEEEETFDLATDGDTILEEAESYGMDAPYSCRGGICSTCKGKVLEGSAKMDKNFTLSKEEVAEGYILTCQAHPTSPTVIVSYDE